MAQHCKGNNFFKKNLKTIKTYPFFKKTEYNSSSVLCSLNVQIYKAKQVQN